MGDAYRRIECISAGGWIEIVPLKPGEVFVPPPGYKKYVPQVDAPVEPQEDERGS